MGPYTVCSVQNDLGGVQEILDLAQKGFGVSAWPYIKCRVLPYQSHSKFKLRSFHIYSKTTCTPVVHTHTFLYYYIFIHINLI